MTVKRYAVFMYDKYYPGGGMSDFKDSFDTVEEAKTFVKNDDHSKESWNDSYAFNQWQIYDMQEMKIMANEVFSDDYEAQKKKDEETIAAFLEDMEDDDD